MEFRPRWCAAVWEGYIRFDAPVESFGVTTLTEIARIRKSLLKNNLSDGNESEEGCPPYLQPTMN